MAQPMTVTRMTLPPAAQVLNGLAGIVQALHTPMTDLDRGSLHREASRRKKLHDFGDPRYLDFLDKTLQVISVPEMTPLARLITRQSLVKALSNRLMIQEHLRRHPEIRHIPIQRPIFIVGFPRTGTTLLQNLLSLDGGSRALKFWELHTPMPLLEDPEKDRKRRQDMAKRVLKAAVLVAPEQLEMHDVQYDTPEECWQMMATTFAVMNFDLQTGIYGFGDWLFQQDMTWPYREYRSYLQILAAQEPTRHFILKCPEHMWFLDALLQVFPDAGIVWTHRDPLDSVASYCSMISLMRRILYGRINPLEVGTHISNRFLRGVQRGMQTRDRLGDHNFMDIQFHELVKDPAGVVRRIKEWHGLPHNNASEQAVKDWLGQRRKDGKGKHKYSAAFYGLEAADIHQRFAPYIQRFGISVRG